MTTNEHKNQQEQRNSRNYQDENNSDDTLLLMADDDDNTPLLKDTNNTSAIFREETLADESVSSLTHCHVPEDKFDFGSRNRLILVLLVCIIFMSAEIVGGILSNSTAVITDAAHMAIDVTSFLISLTAMYLGTKKPTKKLSYGYIRAEVLGALLSVLTIWLVTGVLVYMAVERCINQNFTIQPLEMIIVAACGVFFNIVMFFILHANVCGNSLPHHGHSHGGQNGHSHGNHHGHSHGGENGYSHNDHHGHSHDVVHTNSDTAINADSTDVDTITGRDDEQSTTSQQSSQNINVRAAMIHVIGDFVQSVGVLCAAIVIKFKPEYKLADPICTFVFSILVLITTITIMRDIVLVLMEGVPSHVSYNRVLEDLLRLPGVRHAHSLHIWSLSVQRAALSVHIAINSDQDYLTVLNKAQDMLRSKHSIARMTIQVEPYDETVMSLCETCRPLST